MKRLMNVMAILLISSAVFLLNSCKKNEAPVDLVLTSIHAGASNLNMATPATDVALDTSIEAGFNTKIDPSTATTENVTLMRNYDNTPIDISISVFDTAITVKPNEPLGTGTQYTLSFGMGIKSTDGKALMTSVDRSFTTMGTFAVPGAFAQWTFDGNANDVMGNYNPSANGMVDISFVDGRNAASGQAASFNGTTSIIEIPDAAELENTSDFAISFWVKLDTAMSQHNGYFVLGLGDFHGFQFEIDGNGSTCKLAATYNVGDTATTSEDLWCDAGGNLGWQGWTFSKDFSGSGGLQAVLGEKWANIVCVYNSMTKVGTMYINGEKVKSQDFNLWPAGDFKQFVTGMKYSGMEPTEYPTFTFGFAKSRQGTQWQDTDFGNYDSPASNHFKGLLDDVIIYHKVLTAEEISLMYNSGK